MDQELADPAAYAPGRRRACTHQMATLFCVKWRRGRGREWRHIRNPTPLLDAFLIEYNPAAKFHPDLTWNDGALGCFEERRPNNKKNKMRSVPNLEVTEEKSFEHDAALSQGRSRDALYISKSRK